MVDVMSPFLGLRDSFGEQANLSRAGREHGTGISGPQLRALWAARCSTVSTCSKGFLLKRQHLVVGKSTAT